MVKRKIAWDDQIGRRLRLRDLHVFFTVTQCGSMAKAAAQLAVAQPTISEVIMDLEHAFGVRLLDRSPRGVEPTIYGNALLKRIIAVFDELKQSGNDIAFLADPTVGELKIACPESIASSILPPIMQRLTERHPGIVLDIDSGYTAIMLRRLRNRELDLILARTEGAFPIENSDELNVEALFDDELVVAAATSSPWARRRKIDLADLIDENWILTASDTWNYRVVAEAYAARGLPLPKISMRTLSVHIRTNMLLSGRFITALPRSVLHLYGDRFALQALPVDLPARPWPVAIVTLRNRTLSPVVDRFIECAREVVRSVAGKPAGRAKRKVA
jgi:DNA-binding transcriptional LysR family regulator